MQYGVVWADNIDDFCREVQLKINDGWEPQGGLSYHEDFWAQAVIKREADTSSEEQWKKAAGIKEVKPGDFVA